MKSFNVLHAEYGKIEHYDIMPHLIHIYKEIKQKYKRPQTFDEIKEFIISNGRYTWWGKCEWEIIVSDWPKQENKKKIDVFEQIMMNIDIITEILMENLKTLAYK